MKNFRNLCEQRRSVHDFAPGFMLSETQFHQILESVRLTPSGYNAQPWSFALVQSPEKLQELQQIAYGQDHVLTAGNVIIVLGDREFGTNEAERIVAEWVEHRNYDKSKADALYASMTKDREDWKKREMMLRNCALAAMTLMYAAEDLGLATCPMMGFRQLELRKWLGLPEEIIPVMMIAVGEQRVESGEQRAEERLPRKSVEELVWGVL